MEDKQDETMKERIIGLLRKGYKRGQLIHDFGFAERTVDAAIRTYKELSNGNAGGDKESGTPTADEEASAPPSKSRGRGATGTAGRDGLLAIRKEKESVLPEWLESDVAEIFDGQTRDQRIFLAGMSVPLMGLRLFAEGVKPIIDLLSVWQQGQAEAARAAQMGGSEMAAQAAQQAAQGVAAYLEQTKPWISASSNPMQAMLADLMRPLLQNVMSRFIPGMPAALGQPQGERTASPSVPGAPEGFSGFTIEYRHDEEE